MSSDRVSYSRSNSPFTIGLAGLWLGWLIIFFMAPLKLIGQEPVDNLASQDDLEELRQRIEKLEKSKRLEQNPPGWQVQLGGHFQTDYVNWAQADPAIADAKDYVELRRIRLVAEGQGYGQFDFRLQMTLEPEALSEEPLATIPSVRDAYVSMKDIPLFGRLRIGNFFVPFGLEQITTGPNLVFLERSIPTQGLFTAGREVGFALYNSTADHRLTWTHGYFFDGVSDSLKEVVDDNQGLRMSGRLTFLPLVDDSGSDRWLLHTGMGILHTNDQDNHYRFRARPHINNGTRLIDSGGLDGESYTTGNLETAAILGPLTIQSEAYLSSLNLETGDQPTIQGAYIHFSYFLTGENRHFDRFGQHGASFGRTQLRSNFRLGREGYCLGAWELKARWSYLDLSNLRRGQYNDLTMGFNWHWTERMRMMFDWIHPFTESDSLFGTTQSDILAMRFDVSW
jgi:phosphate-selective porin OprO and OprP